jgi:oxygen-independent coproporphyrinogen-3 oxidase
LTPLVLQQLGTTKPPEIQALYIHTPFCFHKCHYCDFYSLVDRGGQGDIQATFLRRLIAELHLRAAQAVLRPTTIFVGGGTPTLLRPALWQQLLEALRRTGVLRNVTEFTVEANPETVTPAIAEALAAGGAGGVNRVSIGAQSFDPQLLRCLERWHKPSSVARAVATLRAAGITNVNVDLIFAIPGQTLDLLDADLDAALALAPNHISYYGLTYEPNTPLTQRRQLGRVQPIDEDLERIMYERVLDRLEDAGFEHYEISNWARSLAEPGTSIPGATGGSPAPLLSCSPVLACLHNLAYWHNRNWLGLGPSAASHVDGHRWKNEAHLGHYLESEPEPPIVDYECLPPDRRLGEQLMLRLRLRAGVDNAFLQDNLAPSDARHAVIAEMRDLGLLEQTATHLRLTRRGLFVADAVIAKLL